MPSWVPVVSALVTFVVTAGAAREVWQGRYQPNLVSWVLWAAIPAIAVAAALLDGAGWAVAPVAAGPPACLLVILAALVGPHRHARWQLGRLDAVCGALAVLAVAGWWLTGDGVVAVVLAVVADLLATWPTLVKAWRHHSAEPWWCYAVTLANSVVAVAALLLDGTASATTLAFPLYVIVVCAALTVGSLPGRQAARAGAATQGG